VDSQFYLWPQFQLTSGERLLYNMKGKFVESYRSSGRHGLGDECRGANEGPGRTQRT